VRINSGAMERVTRDNINISRKILFESSNFWRFTRSLATDYSVLFCSYYSSTKILNMVGPIHTWSVHCHDFVNRSSFNIVDDVITDAGNEMTIGKDINLLL
jgi:hypothetical protein